MSVEDNVKRILTEKGIPFELLEHEPVYTSEQAAKARGLDSPSSGVKAMIFRTDGMEYILVLNPGDRKIDLEKICQLEKVRHLRLAKPEEVKEIAGVEPGAVPPFGLKTRLKTYMSGDIVKNEHVYFNCGNHSHSIKMLARDLLKAVENPILFH